MELHWKEKINQTLQSQISQKRYKNLGVLSQKINLEERQLREEIRKRGNWFTRIFSFQLCRYGTAKDWIIKRWNKIFKNYLDNREKTQSLKTKINLWNDLSKVFKEVVNKEIRSNFNLQKIKDFQNQKRTW